MTIQAYILVFTVTVTLFKTSFRKVAMIKFIFVRISRIQTPLEEGGIEIPIFMYSNFNRKPILACNPKS